MKGIFDVHGVSVTTQEYFTLLWVVPVIPLNLSFAQETRTSGLLRVEMAVTVAAAVLVVLLTISGSSALQAEVNKQGPLVKPLIAAHRYILKLAFPA